MPTPVTPISLPIIKRATPASSKIKLLLYANPGVGKTTFGGQANDHPALGPALFLNFEAGLMSVAGRGDIDEVEIKNLDELEAAYFGLLYKQGDYGKYQTIIIDSASELYSRALQEAVEDRAAGKSLSGGRKPNQDVDEIEVGDYGKAGYNTIRLFRAFRDLPLHVIATAHARFEYAKGADVRNSQPIEVKPNFSKNVCTQMMGIFDFVWYMYLYEVESQPATVPPTFLTRRAILTSERGAYKCKNRAPRLEAVTQGNIDQPYLPAIYEMYVQAESGYTQPTNGTISDSTVLGQDGQVIAQAR